VSLDLSRTSPDWHTHLELSLKLTSLSIALDSSRQPTLRIEWQATNTILVQLLRDENGNFTLSFRRRQRF